MEIDLIFKIAGIGILLAVINQVLTKAGREDQAMLANITGVVIVLMMLVKKIGVLFTSVKGIFDL